MPKLKSEPAEAKKPVRKKSSPSKVAPKIEESLEGGRVYVERNRTVNIGDFNSVKITVGVDLPLNPTDEYMGHVKETIETGDGLVEERITEILERVVPHERSKDYS